MAAQEKEQQPAQVALPAGPPQRPVYTYSLDPLPGDPVDVPPDPDQMPTEYVGR